LPLHALLAVLASSRQLIDSMKKNQAAMFPTWRPAHRLSGLLAAVAFAVCVSATAGQSGQSCQRVDAYWNTNFHKLKANISGCEQDKLWHKCSQAAAIHYDLGKGSLGQRARSCGLAKPSLPGSNHTTPGSSDSRSCKAARKDLQSAFENRAMARLACAAARNGGSNQAKLDAACIKFRARITSFHAPFRSVAKHCELNFPLTYAMGS